MKKRGGEIGGVTFRLHCQSFGKKFHSYYNKQGSNVAFTKCVTNCFLWEWSLISSSFYLSLLSIHLYLPLHFPLFLIILILSVSLPRSVAQHPFLPLLSRRARLHFLRRHHSSALCRACPARLPSPLPRLLSPFPPPAHPGCSPNSSPVLRPSQMSDHSLVFRLPCHHIFHTSPSLNWACIIISYHVEYLITARDERWPPWTLPNVDRHRPPPGPTPLVPPTPLSRPTQTHSSVDTRDRDPCWRLCRCAFLHLMFATKLSAARLLRRDRWDGVYSWCVRWCLYQLLVAFVMRETMPWSQRCRIYTLLGKNTGNINNTPPPQKNTHTHTPKKIMSVLAPCGRLNWDSHGSLAALLTTSVEVQEKITQRAIVCVSKKKNKFLFCRREWLKCEINLINEKDFVHFIVLIVCNNAFSCYVKLSQWNYDLQFKLMDQINCTAFGSITQVFGQPPIKLI